MNKNVIIVLAGGFLIAIVVALLMQSMMNKSKQQQALQTEKIQVLVAAKDLKVGQDLAEGDLKWTSWPKDAVFMGAIIRDGEQTAMEAAHGKILRPLVEGQPMHSSLLIEEDKGQFLSANVEKGMRAVGISVKSHVLSDRLIRPGDYVDVMVTYKVKVNTKTNPEAQSLVNNYATETMIENVRVLAIDDNDTLIMDDAEEEGKKKKNSKTATVTLQVKPEQAEKLVLSDKLGTVTLALRSIGDADPTKTDNTTTDVHMSQVMTKLSRMNGSASSVRIYNGGTMQETQVRQLDTEASGVDYNLEDGPNVEQNIMISPETLLNLGEE